MNLTNSIFSSLSSLLSSYNLSLSSNSDTQDIKLNRLLDSVRFFNLIQYDYVMSVSIPVDCSAFLTICDLNNNVVKVLNGCSSDFMEV